MNIILSIVGLIAGFALLMRGADYFVDGASGLATRMGISPLVAGLTIVALGTSAPEAALSIATVTQTTGSMSVANALGSNIVNVLVILGLTALVSKVPVSGSTLRIEIPFVLAAGLFLLSFCLNDGILGRLEAFALLGMLVGYLYLLLRGIRSSRPKSQDEVARQTAPRRRLVLMSVAGVAGIALGAQLAIRGASELGGMLGISERVLGLTVMAIGTSLPELVTSLTAARKGQTDIAMGNVMGSCILNIVLVLGISGLIRPVPLEGALLFDALVTLGSVALLWALSVRRRALSRAGGAALLACYAAYLGAVLV